MNPEDARKEILKVTNHLPILLSSGTGPVISKNRLSHDEYMFICQILFINLIITTFSYLDFLLAKISIEVIIWLIIRYL